MARTLHRRSGSVPGGEVQLHTATADFILQFQNNSLGDFFADTLGGADYLFLKQEAWDRLQAYYDEMSK